MSSVSIQKSSKPQPSNHKDTNGTEDDLLNDTQKSVIIHHKYVYRNEKEQAQKILEWAIPECVTIRFPVAGETPFDAHADEVVFYEYILDIGLRFPFSTELLRLFGVSRINPSQLVPNSWRILFAAVILSKQVHGRFSATEFLTAITISGRKTEPFLYFIMSNFSKFLQNLPDCNKVWKDRFIYISGDWETGKKEETTRIGRIWTCKARGIPLPKDSVRIERAKLNYGKLVAAAAEFEFSHSSILTPTNFICSELWSGCRALGGYCVHKLRYNVNKKATSDQGGECQSLEEVNKEKKSRRGMDRCSPKEKDIGKDSTKKKPAEKDVPKKKMDPQRSLQESEVHVAPKSIVKRVPAEKKKKKNVFVGDDEADSAEEDNMPLNKRIKRKHLQISAARVEATPASEGNGGGPSITVAVQQDVPAIPFPSILKSFSSAPLAAQDFAEEVSLESSVPKHVPVGYELVEEGIKASELLMPVLSKRIVTSHSAVPKKIPDILGKGKGAMLDLYAPPDFAAMGQEVHAADMDFIEQQDWEYKRLKSLHSKDGMAYTLKTKSSVEDKVANRSSQVDKVIASDKSKEIESLKVSSEVFVEAQGPQTGAVNDILKSAEAASKAPAFVPKVETMAEGSNVGLSSRDVTASRTPCPSPSPGFNIEQIPEMIIQFAASASKRKLPKDLSPLDLAKRHLTLGYNTIVNGLALFHQSGIHSSNSAADLEALFEAAADPLEEISELKAALQAKTTEGMNLRAALEKSLKNEIDLRSKLEENAVTEQKLRDYLKAEAETQAHLRDKLSTSESKLIVAKNHWSSIGYELTNVKSEAEVAQTNYLIRIKDLEKQVQIASKALDDERQARIQDGAAFKDQLIACSKVAAANVKADAEVAQTNYLIQMKDLEEKVQVAWKALYDERQARIEDGAAFKDQLIACSKAAVAEVRRRMVLEFHETYPELNLDSLWYFVPPSERPKDMAWLNQPPDAQPLTRYTKEGGAFIADLL